MKKLVLSALFLVSTLAVFAQDSTSKWSPAVSLGFEPVPVYHISGVDTSFENSVALSPVLSIRHKSGFGISYSPKFVTGGTTPGIFMHAVTVGIEQYDQKVFNYALTYSHYFFTNNKGVPYSPLTNEVYASFTYKQPWLRPSFSAGIGFGTDTQTTPSSSAYDIGASFGVSHAFSWENSDVNYSLSPSVSINGGTNEYFSLLNITKYVGRSKSSAKTVKNGTGRRNGGSGSTTTTSTTTSHEMFNLNNIEIGLESSIEVGSFSIRPTANVYLPIGSFAGTGVTGYWQLMVEYNF